MEIEKESKYTKNKIVVCFIANCKLRNRGVVFLSLSTPKNNQ